MVANSKTLADAPEGVVVLVNDPGEGICTAMMQIIRSEQFWMPHPASCESDSLRPTAWAFIPEALAWNA